jgi:hypothetical protein
MHKSIHHVTFFFLQHHPLLKAGSPNFSLLVLLGCLVGFAALPFLTIDEGNTNVELATYACRIYPSLVSAGFVLMFGALLAKSYDTLFSNFHAYTHVHTHSAHIHTCSCVCTHLLVDPSHCCHWKCFLEC